MPTHETGLAAYLVAEVVARESLTLGHTVVVDAANYVEQARQMWRDDSAPWSGGVWGDGTAP